MKIQTIENQRGEIEFRRRLVEKQVDKQAGIEDEFDSEEMT
jgi:hypothetical protein